MLDEKKCPMDSPMDSPMDGVMMPTKGVNTKFKNDKVKKQNVINCRITASVQIGILSIRDTDGDTMLTVSLVDAMETINRAVAKAKENENGLDGTGDNQKVQ